MKNFIVKYIRQCNDEFIKENPMDGVDINIVDNFTDYIVERIEILFDEIERNKHGVWQQQQNSL